MTQEASGDVLAWYRSYCVTVFFWEL